MSSRFARRDGEEDDAYESRLKGIWEADRIAARSGEVEGGRWVRITGLQSSSGKKLNGRVGQVLNEAENSDGRFQIKIDGDASSGKLIKASNFVNIPREDMVKTCRLMAKGEPAERTYNSEHKVLLFPRDHSMFQTRGNVPVMRLAGLPLMVEKVKPYADLSDFGAMDNRRATHLMIQPHNGFAPYEWLDDVGPVLVYRPGGLDLDYEDMVVVNTYIYELLDEYSEGPEFNPMTWLNREKFQEIALREKSERPHIDLNILM